jgi:MoaA/NifB/PqqE/SkfB family radical SAM enzyme
MGLRFSAFALMLTDKCNARCAHCYGDYGPKGNSRLPISEAIELIDQAAPIECIERNFVAAGGETFLFFDDLVCVVQYAANRGFKPSITTNAFWGKPYERAWSWMKRLKEAGLVKLEISADSFHQKHIPIEAPRNVIRAAKECGLETVMLRCQVTENTTLRDALQNLGIGDLANTIVVSSPVVPMGRAEQEISADEVFLESAYPRGCCEDALTLTITVQGDVFPCCAGSELCPPLCLGNVTRESLATIVNRAHSNIMLRTLASVGPARLSALIEESNLNHLLLPAYTNACHLCYHIFSQLELAEYVVSKIEARQIAALKAIASKVSGP